MHTSTHHPPTNLVINSTPWKLRFKMFRKAFDELFHEITVRYSNPDIFRQICIDIMYTWFCKIWCRCSRMTFAAIRLERNRNKAINFLVFSGWKHLINNHFQMRQIEMRPPTHNSDHPKMPPEAVLATAITTKCGCRKKRHTHTTRYSVNNFSNTKMRILSEPLNSNAIRIMSRHPASQSPPFRD